MSHQDLYYKAELAIKEIFNDVSVSREVTRLSLEELISEIEIMLDALGS